MFASVFQKNAPSRVRTIVRLSVAGALLMSTAACGSNSSDTDAKSASFDGDCSAQTKIKLAVTGNIVPSNLLPVAVDEGFFKDHNVDVTSAFTDSTATAVAGMLGGSIDIALVGMEFATVNEKGEDFIAVGAVSNIGLWTYAAKPGIKSFSDLKGKRVAVSIEKGISAVALSMAAEQAGVSADSITLVPSGGSPARYAALIAGQVDAASLGAPFTEQAAAEGFSTLGYAEEGETPPPLASGVFIVKRDWAKSHGAELTCFLAGTLDSYKWAKDPANLDDLAKASAETMGGTDVALVKEAWEKVSKEPALLPLDGAVDLEGARNATEANVEFGVLQKMPDLDSIIDNSYAEAAAEFVKADS